VAGVALAARFGTADDIGFLAIGAVLGLLSRAMGMLVAYQHSANAVGPLLCARLIRAELPGLGIVLLSQHIETRHSVELVASGRFGYLLKDRVLDVDDFLDALRRVAAGGSALDPEVVARLIGTRRDADPLGSLTAREREVLALMAEGRTNVGIARRLWLTDHTVETHVGSIMSKLGLSATDEDHRRVLAVLAWLEHHPVGAAAPTR